MLLLLLTGQPARPALAADDNFDHQCRHVLQLEAQMQALSCRFCLEAACEDFARQRRSFIWDGGNAVATEGGLISAAAVFFNRIEDHTVLRPAFTDTAGHPGLSFRLKHIHNPASGEAIAATLYPQIAGQVIGGSGALYELTRDARNARRLKKMKLNRNQVLSTLEGINRQVDENIAALNARALTKSQLSEVQFLAAGKKRVLSDFVRALERAAGKRAGALVEDSVGLTRNVVGAVGNSINAAAVLESERTFNGDGTILNLIAASLITMRPVLANTLSARARKHDRKIALRLFPEAKLPAEGGNEPFVYPPAPGDDAGRLQLYENFSKLLAEHESILGTINDREKKLSFRRYRETVYGPGKMTQSILGLIIGFEHSNNITLQNRLAASGNTIYTTAQVFNIIELLRQRVMDEKSHAALALKNGLPEQKLMHQLEQIKQLQSTIAK